MVGMGLGVSIWSCANLIVGWMTGKFGLLGTNKDTSVIHPTFDYLGVLLMITSMALFFMVKPTIEPKYVM